MLKISLQYFKKLFDKYISDGCVIYSSSIAYFSLFSIFPLMLVLLSLSGIMINRFMFQSNILDFVNNRVPIIYEFVKNNIETIVENRKSIGIIGSIFLIISTTYVFDVVQIALNKIYNLDIHLKYWKQKLYGFATIATIIIITLVSFTISTSLFYLANLLVGYFNIDFASAAVLLKVVSIIISLLFNFLIFSLFYYFGTQGNINLKTIYKGALTVAICWEGAKHLFIFYLDKYATFAITYGSISSVIAFLFWIYFSSLIFLLGAEINSITK